MKYRNTIEKRMEQKMKYYVTKGVKVLFFIIMGLTLAFLVGYIVMRLWNWLMPQLFGWPSVNYWQAVGLLILAKIFFGFGNGNGPRKHHTSKTQNISKKCGPLRKDFSEWKHYGQFWEEEGEQAYKAYLERNKENLQ